VIKIVLFAVFGRLGDGKTLCLTYLTFEHWFHRREKIYANYHLFKIPFIYINGVNQLNIPQGSKESMAWAALDEIWRLINARTPLLKRNQIVYDILGRSRKKSVTFCFSSQLKRSMDRLVVDVLDFISKPSMTPDNTLCRLDIFAGSKASSATLINSPRFITAPFMMLFDTNEQIDMEEFIEGDPPIIFQANFNEEHGYCCQCEKCGTKFFKTWEEATLYGSEWWEKNWRTVFDETYLRAASEE
jgi:hypothetical protein